MTDTTSTLHSRLRKQADCFHREAHALPFFKALLNGSLQQASYVGQLRCLAIVFGVFEHTLSSLALPAVRELVELTRPKYPLLLDDLSCFSSSEKQTVIPAVNLALALSGKVLLRRTDAPFSLTGYLYTLEGSTMGGAVMRPFITKAFQAEGKQGASFLSCCGDRAKEKWSHFIEVMERNCPAADEDAVIDASKECFEGLMEIYRALHPLDAGSMGMHISMINPEAGNHPVPFDPSEIEASFTAGRETWDEYPYYAARYGERGLRFTRSDSAWLVTLCECDESTVIKQVMWLCNVLSSRGMPTIMMESHLMRLYEHLCASVPRRKEHYRKLLTASEYLRENRRRYIADRAFEETAGTFDAAIPETLKTTVGNSGRLVVSSVIDDMSQENKDGNSFITWMTEPGRFGGHSEELNALIRATIEMTGNHTASR